MYSEGMKMKVRPELAAGEQCSKSERTSAAQIILKRLEETKERTEKIASIVEETTDPVTRKESQAVGSGLEKESVQSFPPLFERISGLVFSINHSLDRIEDNMRRIEL